MLVSTAQVATERPTFYLRSVCEHFADVTQRHSDQRFDVSFDEHEGFIDFAPVVSGTCRLDARRGGRPGARGEGGSIGAPSSASNGSLPGTSNASGIATV